VLKRIDQRWWKLPVSNVQCLKIALGHPGNRILEAWLMTLGHLSLRYYDMTYVYVWNMEQLDLVLQQLTVSAHPLHESLAFEDAAPFHGHRGDTIFRQTWWPVRLRCFVFCFGKWTEEGTRRCDATQYCALNGAEVTSITTSRTLRAVCKDYSLGFPTWLCLAMLGSFQLWTSRSNSGWVHSSRLMELYEGLSKDTFERDLPTSGGLSGFCNDSIQL